MMKAISDVTVIEDKGCITFTRVCVNLGKVLNTETGKEAYYCNRNFPKDCSKFGCPKLMELLEPSRFVLRTLNRIVAESMVAGREEYYRAHAKSLRALGVTESERS